MFAPIGKGDNDFLFRLLPDEDELAAMPHYHPTLAEIWTWPAEELAEKIPIKK